MGFRGQKGNVVLTLLALLFVGGVAGGVLFLLRPSERQDEKERQAADARAAYDEAVAALERTLRDSRNIDESVGRNPNAFGCLYTGSAACRGQGGAFLLYEAGRGRQPLSHLALDQGADTLGTACRGYPSPECPLRVETSWEPVCAGERCEGTKSFHLRAKVTLAPVLGPEAPLVWSKELLVTPQIALSQLALCERAGGTWAGTECLTPAQLAERQLASSGRDPRAPAAAEGGEAEPARADEAPAPPQYECPNHVVVQGQNYPVSFLAADRAQVSVPAMSCQFPGFYDIFVFQCAARSPASFPNEGQWIQVEAVMAPPCDQDGNPLQTGPRY